MIKNQNGFVATDATIAITAIIIFSTLILTLIYMKTMTNIKIKQQALAILYVTQTFENIGEADYEEITNENVNDFKTQEDIKGISVDLSVEDLEFDNEEEEFDIVKKIKADVSYTVGNKEYSFSMQRSKANE